MPSDQNSSMRLALAVTLALAAASPACATDRCMARIVKDVGADEDPSSVLHKGGNLFPVTQMKIGRKTGRPSYCAHGDYCYGAGAMDMATPCRFDQSDFSDDESIYLTAR